MNSEHVNFRKDTKFGDMGSMFVTFFNFFSGAYMYFTHDVNAEKQLMRTTEEQK